MAGCLSSNAEAKADIALTGKARCLSARGRLKPGGATAFILLSLIALLPGLSFMPPAFASETNDAPPAAPTQPSPTPAAGLPPAEPETSTTPAPQTPVLKGGVRTLILTLNEVKEAGIAIDKAKRLAADLYDEMTRRDVQLEEEPEIIGTTVVYIPVNFDAGAYLPPRKKWVDLYMSQLGPIITAMKEEITDVEVSVPDETKARLRLLFNDWVTIVNDVQTNLASLQDLTKSTPYDSASIVRETAAVHGDMQRLEETRKKIYHVVKKMPKETGNT